MDIVKLLYQLTFTTRGTLEMCGWRPDRSVDTSDYVRALTAKELPTHAIAIDFLSSFGGLALRVPHPYVPSTIRTAWFDPIEGAESEGNLQYWEGFQRATGIQLTVIGQYRELGESLSLDRNGAMFINEESDFARIGDDVAMSLNALCEGRPLPERIKFDKSLAYGW